MVFSKYNVVICVFWNERARENPGMTFLVKKRINTELFIDRTKGETQIRVGTNVGDQPAGQADWSIEYVMRRNVILN